MNKPSSKLNIHTSVVLAASLFVLNNTALLAETITMRTWYPSPYGSYRRARITESLQVGTSSSPLAVNGNINQTGNFSAATVNGSTVTASIMRLTPTDCSKVNLPGEGSLCVDSKSGNTLKIYTSGNWNAVGGASSVKTQTLTGSFTTSFKYGCWSNQQNWNCAPIVFSKPFKTPPTFTFMATTCVGGYASTTQFQNFTCNNPNTTTMWMAVGEAAE